MGIYDRCEKDVKNCRPHSLKPEDGLLTIDKDVLCLFVCIHLEDVHLTIDKDVLSLFACIHLTPKGTKS